MTVKELTDRFLSENEQLLEDGSYRGWVRGFHGATWRGQWAEWDLSDPRYRFGLYCLASAWSRTGRWEGPVRLALAMAAEPDRWLNPDYWARIDISGAKNSLYELVTRGEQGVKIPGGRNATARTDCAASFTSIAAHFPVIEKILADLNSGRLSAVMAKAKLREIPGTGCDMQHAWDMKIHLIFRELRCAGWSGIPGEVCCVPDARVRKVYDKIIGDSLPVDHFQASRQIYQDFGDLYDLPPFLALDWFKIDDPDTEIDDAGRPGVAPSPIKSKGLTVHLADTDSFEDPVVWGEPVPKRIVPTSCNTITMTMRFLEGGVSSLGNHERQAFRDLKFDQLDRGELRELMAVPGGLQTLKLLRFYEQNAEGHVHSLPRPILDTFWVGWLGIQNRRCTAMTLHAAGVGGTTNAAQAVLTVGKSTGILFSLLDGDSKPTQLFMAYFQIEDQT